MTVSDSVSIEHKRVARTSLAAADRHLRTPYAWSRHELTLLALIIVCGVLAVYLVLISVFW